MHRGGLVWLAALSLGLGCGDDGGAGKEVVLDGRVFAADTGKPLTGSMVVAPGGKQATTDSDGSFSVRYPSTKEGPVRVESQEAAPVSKDPPSKGGYIELHVKAFDAQQEIEADKGGAAAAANGARLEVGGDVLTRKGDGGAAQRPKLQVAAPDPSKASDLPSIPGNFDAKKGDRVGKLSTESPIYVGGKDGDRPLELKQGAHASVDLPVRDNRKGIGDTAPLYHFDEAQGVWVEQGTAQEVLNAAGMSVYRAEVDALGWWALGEFYDQLGCLHGCVHDSAGNAVASARVLATGVDHYGQVSAYTEADGCYTLEVRASSALLVSAQVEGAFAAPSTVSSSGDAQACVEVPTLTLVTSSGDGCPLGLVACGDRCVEIGADMADCGGPDAGSDSGTGCPAGFMLCGDQCVEIGADGADCNLDGGSDSGADTGPDISAFFPLTVSTEGTGVGVVTSTPGGISCGDLCSAEFAAGSQITLSAQPGPANHTFAGWGGDCTGSEPTCVVTMDAAHSVTANFALPNWQLTVSPSTGGTVRGVLEDGTSQVIACDASQGSSDCVEVLAEGTLVTLVAAPSANMSATWSGACTGVTGLTCTLRVLQTTDVSVTFAPIQYTVSVVISGEVSPGPGVGSITLSAPPGASCDYPGGASPPVTCVYTYNAGTPVTLTAVPANLNYFGSWGGACAGVDAMQPCTLTIGNNTTVTGSFGYIIP